MALLIDILQILGYLTMVLAVLGVAYVVAGVLTGRWPGRRRWIVGSDDRVEFQLQEEVRDEQ